MYFFPNLEPVPCSISDSNCCFLTWVQVSQKAGKMVWYSQLLKNFPQLVVIHTVKGFGVVKETEVDAFLEFSCFFYDPMYVGNWSLAWRILSITLLSMWNECSANDLEPDFF